MHIFASQWVLFLPLLICVGMHFFMHGGPGGHGGKAVTTGAGRGTTDHDRPRLKLQSDPMIAVHAVAGIVAEYLKERSLPDAWDERRDGGPHGAMP